MSYTELIQRALHGRSVLQAAKELGLPQSTLHNYCSGKRMPDYLTAFMLAKEAGVDPREMFMALVEEDAKKKGVLEKFPRVLMRCCHSSSRAGTGFRRADSSLKLGLTLRRLCTYVV